MTTSQVVIYILQMRKLGLKVIKRLAQVYECHAQVTALWSMVPFPQCKNIKVPALVSNARCAYPRVCAKGIHSSTKVKSAQLCTLIFYLNPLNSYFLCKLYMCKYVYNLDVNIKIFIFDRDTWSWKFQDHCPRKYMPRKHTWSLFPRTEYFVLHSLYSVNIFINFKT